MRVLKRDLGGVDPGDAGNRTRRGRHGSWEAFSGDEVLSRLAFIGAVSAAVDGWLSAW